MWCWNCCKQYHWHWALPAFTKMISVHTYLFSNYFQHVTFGALAVSAKDTCTNCIFPFLFLFSFLWEGWGTYQLLSQQISWNSETLSISRGQIAIKLRPVVKSATKIACSYCYNSECVQAKWQEHISRHFQCFVERWTEKDMGRNITIITCTVMV